MSHYKKIPNQTGIRKDLKNGKYLAIKYINGTEYSRKFTNLKDAINWRASFHPAIPEALIERSLVIDRPLTNGIRGKMNGEDLGFTFGDIWSLYKDNKLSTLEKSTRDKRIERAVFFEPLMKFKMVEITATLIDRFMSDQKREAMKLNGRRLNFNNDLKNLKAVFNWYRENYDALFISPILKRHKEAGVIKKGQVKHKKLSPEELILFFQELDPFWRDFAETQFYLAARVSEVAGLQAECVDFKNREIRVQYALVWGQNKKFDYLKDRPKNGEISYASMNDRVRDIMLRRVPEALKGYIFHSRGRPLQYREIQYQYNEALKRAGLYPKYSATHMMRHSMGTITRRVTGSMDMAQAVTRHKDIKVAQQYAGMPTEANKKAVNDVFEYLNLLEKEG